MKDASPWRVRAHRRCEPVEDAELPWQQARINSGRALSYQRGCGKEGDREEMAPNQLT